MLVAELRRFRISGEGDDASPFAFRVGGRPLRAGEIIEVQEVQRPPMRLPAANEPRWLLNKGTGLWQEVTPRLAEKLRREGHEVIEARPA
jgi:hypothetical protein